MRDWGVTRWLVDRRSDESVPIIELLTLPGDLIVIAIVLAGLLLFELYQTRNTGPAADRLLSPKVWSMVAIIVGGLSLIVALESIFALDRPPAELQAVSASPHSFPSGHTMAATVTWVAIAWWYAPRNRRMRLALVLGIVGLARMTLGLHYLADILAGIGFGLLYLWMAGKWTFGRPRAAFTLAVLLGAGAAVLSGASSRGLLAFGGTIGWFVLWRVLEYPKVRSSIRKTVTH